MDSDQTGITDIIIKPIINHFNNIFHVIQLFPHLKMAVFWDIAPYSLVEVHRRFICACCLHHQDDALMEAASTSETKVNIPKDFHLHTRSRENLKSHIPTFSLSFQRVGVSYKHFSFQRVGVSYKHFSLWPVKFSFPLRRFRFRERVLFEKINS
jgi:hypothetical protein